MRLLAHNDGRELRGNERQLLHLARGLAAGGHDVLVSCRPGGALMGELDAVGVATTRVRPRGDAAVRSALAFRRLARARRPDAVLLTSWKRVFVGSWMAKRAGVPRVVVRLGIARPIRTRGSAGWKLRRAFERWVDALVVNSEAVRDLWLDAAPWFAPARVHLIRNGVVAVPGDPDRLRSELGLPRPARLIVAVGAVEPRKGIDLLVHALPSLPADVHLVVAGRGPEAGRLRGRAAALGVHDRVHWLGARSDVPDVLAGGDVFVLPTRQDSIPNALLEAMTAGVPVVTTRGNGAEEALGPSRSRPAAGWIVPPEDPAALAGAVRDALASGRDKVLEARWRARHWFGVERMVEEYRDVLFPAATGADRV